MVACLVEFSWLVLHRFISLLVTLRRLIRYRSRFCSLGLSCVFFPLLGCEIGSFLGFADFGVWFWRVVCGESVLDLAPLMGGLYS